MRIKGIVVIILIIVGVGSVLLISNMRVKNRLEHISNSIELEFSDCSFYSEKNTHDGFLGDGEYFAKVICNDIKYDNLASNWKRLPLTKPLIEATGIRTCSSGNGCKDVYERYSIPQITNGYYYFLDRHHDSTDKYDDSDINDRSSYNYSLAFLDINNNTIYYYELDT